MSTKRERIEVGGIRVEVVRKDIRNLHLAVYPPNGRIRVAIPSRLDDDAVRLAVISRLAWIRRKQAGFQRQERQPEREMVTGESHYVHGRRRRLDVTERPGRPWIGLRGNRTLALHVRPGTGRERRESLVHGMYRNILRQQVPDLIAKWEAIVGVKVADWRIKRMKTRWGTCTAEARRIWLNLELAKKSPQCLEYVLVHEMAHLLEPRHNDRFREHMDRVLPQWRMHRDTLNQAPLSHENWAY